ncbi:MAG: hypothetical protein ACOY3Y_08095, partial [Acidobacteriota bacterium]
PAATLAWPLLEAGFAAPSWLGPAASRFVLGAGFMVVAAAIVAVVTRRARERVAALAVAALLTAGAFALPRPDNWKAELERAVIGDVYAVGGERGALEALRERCATPDRCARVDAWIARRDTARSP